MSLPVHFSLLLPPLLLIPPLFFQILGLRQEVMSALLLKDQGEFWIPALPKIHWRQGLIQETEGFPVGVAEDWILVSFPGLHGLLMDNESCFDLHLERRSRENWQSWERLQQVGWSSEGLPSRLISGEALKLEANEPHGQKWAEVSLVHAGHSGHSEAKGEEYESMCQEAYKKH